jgi:hypothetical protein
MPRCSHERPPRGRRPDALLRLCLLLLLAACGREPARYEDCGHDDDCKLRWVVGAFEADPTGVATLVSNEPNRILRTAMILGLTERHPGETVALCDRLESVKDKRYCQGLNARPHLRAAVEDEAPASAGRSLAGPTLFIDRIARATLPAPMAKGPVAKAECVAGQSAAACRTKHAMEYAAAGQLDVVGMMCRGVDEGMWRDECFFTAADHLYPGGGLLRVTPELLSHYLSLCLEAGDFRARCVSHLYTALARDAPALDQRGAAARWQHLDVLGKAAAARLNEVDGALGDGFEDRLWAEALFRAVQQSQGGANQGLAVLPEVAVPHLRAALTLRRILLTGGAAPTLDVAVTAVQDEIDGRIPQAGGRLEESFTPRDFWEEVLSSERGLAWRHYTGDRRRAGGADAREDIAICVLEAAAQARPPVKPLLIDGLSAPSEAVRWTAVRLLAELDPNGPELQRVRDDQSPLVRARLPKG